MKKLIIISFILVLINCSYNPIKKNYLIQELKSIEEFQVNFKPQKSLFSSSEQCFFLLDENFVHIYQNRKLLNSLGGLGFEKNQFDHLSDIALAPDGNLMALDSFQKKIKKFDADGSWMMQISLSEFSEPTAFDIALNEDIYVYDNDKKEVFIIDPFSQKISFSFGKFKLQSVKKLTVYKNSVTAYDQKNDLTHVYNKLGQFQETLDGNIVFWRDKKFKIEKFWITQLSEDSKLAVGASEIIDLFVQEDRLLVVRKNSLQLLQISFRIEK